MNTYSHFVSGFFSHKDQADNALARLNAQGLPRTRIQIFDSQSALPTHTSAESSNEVLKDVLVDSAIGTAVGITIGGLAEVALIAANVTLFVASPLIAPLVLLGWGASIGGLLGASAGAAANTKPLSDLVNDAIKSGQTAVVVETHTEEETTAAKDIFKDLIGDYKDVTSATP
jgi:hypothetical protein